MKIYLLCLAVLGYISVSEGFAVPRRNGLLYYQVSPQYYSRRSAPLTQRMMYLRYVQPQSRTANAGQVSAFAAGDRIATRTYVKETQYHNAQTPSYEYGQPAVSVQTDGATSVAEAFPADYPYENDASNDEGQFEDDPANEVPDVEISTKEKKPKELIPNFEDDPAHEEPALVPEHKTPDFLHPVASVPGPSYIPPKKKIHVELETADSDEYDEEQHHLQPPQNKRNKSAASGNRAPAPAGTYFPIDFGGTSGGAIAIANSFSTGEGGSATSTATAYGSPADGRAKKKAANLRRRH